MCRLGEVHIVMCRRGVEVMEMCKIVLHINGTPPMYTLHKRGVTLF